MNKAKRNIDIFKEAKDIGVLWSVLGESKVPKILRPGLILLVELYHIKDFLEDNQKLITIFGVFGGLTVYLREITTRASYLSFMMFLLVGVLLWIEAISSERLLVIAFGTWFMGGLISEIYRYITSSYLNYLEGSLYAIKALVVVVLSTILLKFIWNKLKCKLSDKSAKSKNG